MPGMGMHLGMRQEQRLEQRQVLALRQVLQAEDMVEPFRTEGENLQISQYDLLKTLEGIVSKGEFLDPEHFSLEINREVFGHPLEMGLSSFGGDLVQVLRTYSSDEEFVKRVLQYIGQQTQTQAGGEQERDLPGKIARAWNYVLSSKYFKKEPKEKRIIDLIENLRQNNASISDGLDVLSRACKLDRQENLVSVSLNKIGEYGRTDARIIPFAQRTLSPVLRVIGTERLSEQESLSLYTEIIEQLYMLDRELRVTNGVENITSAISHGGFRNLTGTKLSIPVLASICTLSPSQETSIRLTGLADTREYQEGRELQRKVYTGISALQQIDNGKEVLEHSVAISHDARSLARILSAVTLVHRNPEFSYPFELKSEEEVLRNLRLQLVDRSLSKIGLSDENLDKYLEKVEKDERFRRIGEILTTLSGYTHYKNPQQTGLIKEILESELTESFLEWRYSHELAEEQLAVLQGKTEEWKKNRSVTRLVGELDALKSHIGAVKDLAPKLEESYREHYQTSVNENTLNDLEMKILRNEETLRQDLSKGETKTLGYETSLLREQLAYTKLLNGLRSLTTDNYSELFTLAETIIKKKSKNPLYDSALWIRDTLDQPVYRDARKIVVVEIDDLETMLRMGEIPVPHCQNWKNNSTYNSSLLSFPADANKKLYHFLNTDNRPYGMSLVRLINNENMPMILVENIYSNEWSDDYGVALIGSLADKALAMYREVGKSVAVACPLKSGHAAHGEKNIQVSRALEKFGQKYKVEIQEREIHLKPAKSKNTKEYWDCGPGMVDSGSGVSLEVNYVVFGE